VARDTQADTAAACLGGKEWREHFAGIVFGQAAAIVVNLECDLVGKYVARAAELASLGADGMTVAGPSR
jgi:hypothetical protein